jgi:hypothetical protein
VVSSIDDRETGSVTERGSAQHRGDRGLPSGTVAHLTACLSGRTAVCQVLSGMCPQSWP